MVVLVFKVTAGHDRPTDQELAEFLALEAMVNQLGSRLSWAIGDAIHENSTMDESLASCPRYTGQKSNVEHDPRVVTPGGSMTLYREVAIV